MGVSGKVTLVAQPKVKKELKITRDQDKKIQAVLADPATFGTSLNMVYMTEAADTMLEELLEPEQKLRLNGLWYQQNGELVLRLPAVAESFHISDEQAAAIESIAKECDDASMALFQKPGRDTQKKVTELKAAASAKIHSLLTTEQAEAWKLALGKPFKF